MAKSDSTAVASVKDDKTLPSIVDDQFFADSGAGLENVRPQDLIIPRITIIQGLSPQVQPKKPEYIQGAVVGNICDVGTGEIFEDPLEFLPVYFVTQWLEWAPRSTGKGLIAIHPTDDILQRCKKDEKNRDVTAEGNLVAQTAQFFGLNMSAGGRRSFIPMTSTQLKKSRRWMTLATSERIRRPDGKEIVPPLWYRIYNLSTADESNAEGDWVGWRIERGLRLQDWGDDWKNIYAEAVDFRDSIKRGEVRGDLDREEGTAVNTSEDAAM